MIKSIKRIQDLGLVFADYTADASTPPFKRCNIMFGWNGSGKSTFSSLFDVIANPQGTSVSYECELEDGTQLRTLGNCPHPIRVFNQDYVDKNVNIVGGQANAITVVLGEASQELLNEIAKDETLLYGSGEPGQYGLEVALGEKRTERTSAVNAKGQLFTDVARTIGAALGGESTRTYRKPDAEADFKGITKSDVKSDDEVQQLLEAAKRNSMPQIASVQLLGPLNKDKYGSQSLPAQLNELVRQSEKLLGRTVESQLVERLATNADISEWVERGITLHVKHDSKDCEYCGKPISADRIAMFSRHFNAADQALKSELDDLTSAVDRISTSITSVKLSVPQAFYKEFAASVTVVVARAESEVAVVLEGLRDFTVSIADKKLHTTEVRLLADRPTATKLSEILSELNALIDRHNKTTVEFDELRTSAIAQLKRHYLAQLTDQVAEYNATIPVLDAEIMAMQQSVRDALDRISVNQSQVSSAHKGCDELNRHLAMFLGHKELKFAAQIEPKSNEVVGYNIVRGDDAIGKLSEGEKTAIALVYFVVHLSDGLFEHTKGIVVVDDPISSLDSNSMYQAFSVIKNAVKDASQIFLLTHNFEFLKLLINWSNRGFGNHAEYFLIKNVYADGARRAHIGPMDLTLRKYDSEYQYLFKLLKTMRDEQDGTIAKAYPVPNIARKFWETFLMFEVPNADNPYKKMELLKQEGFSEEKLDAIYKFVNDQSHLTGGGFDPALVPGAQKVIVDIFDTVQAVSPRHFRVLDAATQ